MTTSDSPAIAPPSEPAPRKRPRRFLPRFGLRSLFVFALVFCLLFGWMGRNLYRMRQEDAAIEALERAGANIQFLQNRHLNLDIGYVPGRIEFAEERTTAGLVARAIGWSNRRSIDRIILYGEDAGDPKFKAALANLWLFPEIRSVELHGPAFDDAAIAPLSALKKLDTLNLARTRATGDGLAALAPTVPLRELVLYDDDPASDIAGGLPAFVEVRSIQLSGMALSNAHLEGIATLPKLETLSLMNVQPAIETETAALAEADGDSPSFDELDFGLPDLDLVPLARAPALVELHLFNANRRSLAGLGRMPQLKVFRLSNLATIEDVQAFSALNPECHVGYLIDRAEGRRFRAGQEIDR